MTPCACIDPLPHLCPLDGQVWARVGSGEQGQGQGQRRLEELSTHDEAGRRLEEAAQGDLDVWKN
jgi:hypothetical protein